MARSWFGVAFVRARELERMRAELAALRSPPSESSKPAQQPAAQLAPGVPPAEPAPAPPEPAAAAPEPAPAPPRPPKPAPPRVALDLIRVADRLDDLTGPAAPAALEESAMALRWLAGQARDLLAVCDVVRLEDAGPVDPLRHEVVGTRPAPTAPQADDIAATVRPGYLWRDRVLRPQQVLAYVPAGEEATS